MENNQIMAKIYSQFISTQNIMSIQIKNIYPLIYIDKV